MTDGDAGSTLLHFYAEVVAKHAKVAHLEGLEHLPLESSKNFHVASSDYEIIDLHSHDQPLLAVVARLHPMLRGSTLELERQQDTSSFLFQARGACRSR